MVGRSVARFVGLAFVMLGVWILVVNLLDIAYHGRWLALILGSGAAGAAGGTLYLLSFDGPGRFRSRPTRLVGWVGMLILALLPWSFWFVMQALVLVAVPSLFLPAKPTAPSGVSHG